MAANIGWLFYKDYFRDINYNNLKDKRNELIVRKNVVNIINQTPNINEPEEIGNIHFKGTTTYPGLILGSGNIHELPSIEGQAILGFHFDYTSGLPVISGSSVKGVLRSAFNHWEYIAEYINLTTKEDVEKLEKEIFDNVDIFFDAEVVKADSFEKILGDDFLAPHGTDSLKNRIPLRFIKVLPNVTFRFDFELRDTKIGDKNISKQVKSKLFQDILSDLGLGAKTNVGYGKFENFIPHKTKKEEEIELIDLERKKELEIKKREEDQKKLQEQKEQKAQGLTQLNSCKDIKNAMKIINDSLGKKARPTPEQKTIIEKFWKRFEKKASKAEVKFFKKFI